MIKVISFDIGGTVLLNKNTDKYNLKELSSLMNISYEEIRIAYKNIFQKEKGTIEELCEKICHNLNISYDEKILDFFKKKFSDNNNECIINNNIEDIINKLKSQGFKIILFSNSCCLIKNALPESILKNIDECFYSYDYGYTKEDKDFYNIIEEKLNCKPQEILHIGDTLKSDYLSPKKCGWNAIYYGESNDLEIISINNLDDIFKYINEKKLEVNQ